MAKRAWLAAVVMTSVMSAGCLQKDVTQTWYLDATTGAVTWSVLEDHVRSDAREAVDRENEEATYYLAVQRQDHPMARGFRQLGFVNPRTRILHDAVPYSVLTDVAATRLDVLGERLILNLGLVGTSVLAKNGGTLEWTMSLRDPHAGEQSREPDDDVSALTGDLDTLTVVLTGGRFDGATGFTVSSDNRAAKIINLDAVDEAAPHDDAKPMVFRLRWIAGS